MTPRVSKAHLEARHREILQAGFRCLARNGLHATTMQEIATEAGLSVGALYRYFDGKEDLIRALAAEGAARRLTSVEQLNADLTATTLADLVSSMVDDLEAIETPDAVRLDVRLWAELLDSPEGYAIMRETLAEMRELVAEFVRARSGTARRDGSGDGEIADPTSEIESAAAGQLVVSLLVGLELQLAYDPQFDVAGYRTALMRLLADL